MIKRWLITLTLIVPALTFIGCGDGDNDPLSEIPEQPGNDNEGNKNEGDDNGGEDNGENDTPVTPGNSKILIAYFSRWGNTDYPSDVDASTGASIQIRNGNKQGTTQIVAEYIQDAVGGDIHLIETSSRYPIDFDDVRDLNHSEMASNYLPPLKNKVENMDDYEIVFVGYPVWATDAPQAIKSFLLQYDMKGKTVIPFCTHDGYGAGRSYTTVENAAVGSTSRDGLSILASDVLSAEDRVKEWLERIGIEREIVSKSVTVSVDGKTFEAEWYDTPLAIEIQAMFPLKATLGKYGDREYYGSMPSRPTNTEEGQLTFRNGDITYCPANNTIAIFYAKADDSQMGQLTMRIIPIGHVTSSLSPFDEMGSRLEFTFDNK